MYPSHDIICLELQGKMFSTQKKTTDGVKKWWHHTDKENAHWTIFTFANQKRENTCSTIFLSWISFFIVSSFSNWKYKFMWISRHEYVQLHVNLGLFFVVSLSKSGVQQKACFLSCHYLSRGCNKQDRYRHYNKKRKSFSALEPHCW
jgi:hypothetical protein